MTCEYNTHNRVFVVVERTGLLCYRVLSVPQLPVCSTCIFWNQSVVMNRTNLVSVMEGLLYWGFPNLRVQFTCIFVHLRWEKNCSLFWLHREYLQYPCFVAINHLLLHPIPLYPYADGWGANLGTKSIVFCCSFLDVFMLELFQRVLLSSWCQVAMCVTKGIGVYFIFRLSSY